MSNITTTTTIRSSLSLLVILLLNLYCIIPSQSFTIQHNPSISLLSSSSTSTSISTSSTNINTSTSSSRLYAKATKSNKKKKRATRNTIGNRTQSTSGFGGAAVTPCPCGSGDPYNKCCGRLHSNAKVYGDASAEEVVRARYSAYAKRQIDFIIGSTHPLNKDFMTDIEHWKKQIEINCYDNFELTKCQIIDETYEGEGEKQIAQVKFIATMIQVDSREKTSFMETSTFERAGKHIREGAWLYKSGVVETVPVDDDDDEEEEEEEEGEGETDEDEEGDTKQS